jgi:hypothetical protein
VYVTCAELGDGLRSGPIDGAEGDGVAPTLGLDDDANFDEELHPVAARNKTARATTALTPTAAVLSFFMGEIVHREQSH